MKTSLPALRTIVSLVAAGALALPLLAQAQNVAVVNGKPVPKSRVDLLVKQVARSGQQVPPDLEARARDEVVLREIFVQEAERRGLAATADYRAQMELARQSILIRDLFEDFRKKNPVTDAEAKTEYDKVRASNSGTEMRASHILVETEAEAKALIAQVKGGAKFEDLAKKSSKDPGSAERGGDLDFAKPDAYVPEFGEALKKLRKGQMTETPIKTQFGWHVIRLDDTREAPFPGFDEVKDQVKQRLEQQKMQKFQEDLRKSAKTDYKFSTN